MVGMANSDRATPASTRRRVASVSTDMGQAATRSARQEGTGWPDWLHEIKLDGYRMYARNDVGPIEAHYTEVFASVGASTSSYCPPFDPLFSSGFSFTTQSGVKLRQPNVILRAELLE